MKEYLPSISVLIPTYNSEKTLGLCLDSIVTQDYPKELIEIIIADAGSTDSTLEIARQFHVNEVLYNPLKTGEAGKSVALKIAKNEIVALIDSDNILDRPDWFRQMIAPFKDSEIIGTEPLYYTYRPTDRFITRYSALMGMNDPLCFYLGNYDRYNYISNRWTEVPVEIEDFGTYLKVKLNSETGIPTIGANGFLIKREFLLKTQWEPYLFDIDSVFELVSMGYNTFAKVKVGIVHIFAGNFKQFVKKQQRRMKDYLFYARQNMRKYPWQKISKLKLIKFVLFTLLVFPLLIDASRGYLKVKDIAWFFHPIACWATLLVYGSNFFLQKVNIQDRTNWNK